MGSASVLVDKATSDLLLRPDWSINMEICDVINTDGVQAKEILKALKRRVGHKNPRIQLLALTLLEMIIKNCGEMVHFLVAERAILQDMVKIVKKKADMQVRDKILVLLDSWQEAFGGPNGKYPQYFWAYEELRRSGVQFPERARNTVPILTPPLTRQNFQRDQAHGSPSNSSVTLDEAMASESQYLSLSDLKAAHEVVEVLAQMLQSLDPKDKQSVKDEVIVVLVDQCRIIQRRNVQLITTTEDEELLHQGLILNDKLQHVFAKHDAIASGNPLPPEPASEPECVSKEEEEDDDFLQLANRNSHADMTSSDKPEERSTSNQGSFMGQLALPAPGNISDDTANTNEHSASPEPPQAVKSKFSKHEEELLDLFRDNTNNDISPITPRTPITATNEQLSPVSPETSIGKSFCADTIQQFPSNNESVHLQEPQTNSNLYQQNVTNANASTINTSSFTPYQSFQSSQYGLPSLNQNYNPWNQANYLRNTQLEPQGVGYQPSQSTSEIPSLQYGSSHKSLLLQPPSSSSFSPSQMSSNLAKQRSFNIPCHSPLLQQQRSFAFPKQSHASTSGQPKGLVGTMQNMSLNDNAGKGKQLYSQRSFVTADHLFDDLIDIRSVSADFKNNRTSQKPSTTNPKTDGTS